MIRKQTESAPLWWRAQALTVFVAVAITVGILIFLVVFLIDGSVDADSILDAVFGAAIAGGFCAAILAVVSAKVRALASNIRASVSNGPDASMPQRSSWGVELTSLNELVQGLRARTQIAEEMATQTRQAFEAAGAGMFELLSGLSAAEEATRGQLSAELHDSVAQTLAAAKTAISQAESRPEALANARSLVDDAEDELRAAMARTRPPQLRNGSLAAAVADMRREFRNRYLVDVRLQWPQDPRPLPMVSAVAVYRFFQEALLNVAKHADVDEATATLSFNGDELIAVVRDEGAGFIPDRVRSTSGRHVGLSLLTERVRLSGGRLTVESTLGRGTTVTMRIPVQPKVALAGFESPPTLVANLGNEARGPER